MDTIQFPGLGVTPNPKSDRCPRACGLGVCAEKNFDRDFCGLGKTISVCTVQFLFGARGTVAEPSYPIHSEHKVSVCEAIEALRQSA